jgi:photosystem II stability/assembly factor-like uncharacterized protein
METRRLRILVAVIAALLPACGGNGSGGSGNPAFPVTMTAPTGGQTFTAPATISISASAADPSSVRKLEFVEGAAFGQAPNTWNGGTIVATSTQPPFHATWADAPAGVHTLVAVATDSLGAQTFSNSVTISVLGPGENPGGWNPIAMVQGEGIWFVDASEGWVVGAGGTILHSGDGGVTWVPQTSGTTQKLSVVQFVDAARGWVVGDGGIVLRTTDGGVTWTPSFPGTAGALLSLSFVDAKRGWVAGLDPSIFETTDGGKSWAALPTGGLNNLAVRFADHSNGWVLSTVPSDLGFDVNAILHTTDGGLTWTEQLQGQHPNDRFLAIDLTGAKTAWAARAGGMQHLNNGIWTTADGGATWIEQNYTKSPNSPPGVGDPGIDALDFVSATQGWGVGGDAASGASGVIIHTEDGGQSWTTQYSPEISPGFAGVHFLDAKRGWALRADGLLLQTTTAGNAP